jgi:tripartite-type tricarboxylate transporter receptor subunit TctC
VALFPHVYSKLGYDVLRDFAPVSTVCMVQFLFVVGPMVPSDVKTVTDFIAWCRANPKLASYGSPGEGTRPHFMGVSLARSAGVEMTHVPYKGGLLRAVSYQGQREDKPARQVVRPIPHPL